MRHAVVAAIALVFGGAAGYLLAGPRGPKHHPHEYDTISVTFPSPAGRVSHTLEHVATFPVDAIDIRVVRPDDWVIRHFDAGDPQGGTITYARVVVTGSP